MALTIDDSRGLGIALILLCVGGLLMAGGGLAMFAVEQDYQYEYEMTVEQVSATGTQPDVAFSELSGEEQWMFKQTIQLGDNNGEWDYDYRFDVSNEPRIVEFNGAVMLMQVEGPEKQEMRGEPFGDVVGFGAVLLGAYIVLVSLVKAGRTVSR